MAQIKEKIIDCVRDSQDCLTFQEMSERLNLGTDELSHVIAAIAEERTILIRLNHSHVVANSNKPREELLYDRFKDLLFEVHPIKRHVAYYAEKLCVTRKYLSTAVKTYSQKTPSKWIRERIVDEIEEKLRYSEDSIKEIAAFLDFPSTSFMGKYLKSVKGVSPKAYRQLYADNNYI